MDNINGAGASIWLGNPLKGDKYLLHIGYNNDSGMYQEEIEYIDLVNSDIMYVNGSFLEGRNHEDIRAFIELNPSRIKTIKSKDEIKERETLQKDIEKLLDKLEEKSILSSSDIDSIEFEKVKKVEEIKVKNALIKPIKKTTTTSTLVYQPTTTLTSTTTTTSLEPTPGSGTINEGVTYI